MVDFLLLRGPHEDAGLARLFGQAVVDVRDDGKGGALWVTEAHIDPVISKTKHTVMISSHSGTCDPTTHDYFYLHLVQ